MHHIAIALFALIFETSYPQVHYDSSIDSLVKSVSADSISLIIASLSGEIPVTLDGVPDSLPVRYAYSPECYDAALWLKEQLETKGLNAELEPVLTDIFTDVDILSSDYGCYGWAAASGWNSTLVEGVYLYRTEDAGATWKGIRNNISHWYKIISLSKDSMWGIAGSEIIRTCDAGLSFQTIANTEVNLYDISDLNHVECWASGGTGTDAFLFSTRDGWNTFTVDSFPDLGYISHVDFASRDTGWYVASYMHFMRTTDAGKTWVLLAPPIKDIYDIEFIDSKTGYVLGRNFEDKGRIIKTTDAGVTWQVLLDSLGLLPRAISISGKDTIWVVGDTGLLLVSRDAGQTWTKKELPTRAQLAAIDVTPDNKACIAGSQEMLYSTNLETWERPRVANGNVMWNAVGEIPGQDSTQILVTAHYDARSDSNTWTPGADDDASGVAAVIEAARLFSGINWKHNIRFICFGGEEVGMFGSRGYANTAYARGDSILAVLNIDMIGYDGNKDLLVEINANPSDSKSIAAAKIFVEGVSTYGIDLVPVIHTTDSRRNSDHSSFWLHGIPALFQGEDRKDFNPFYHKTGDRLKELDTFYLSENVRAAVAWIAAIAELDSIVGTRETPYVPEEIVSVKAVSTVAHLQCVFAVKTPFPLQPKVYDVSGRLVKIMPAIDARSNDVQSVTLDLRDIPAGVYWVIFQGTGTHVPVRIVLIN